MDNRRIKKLQAILKRPLLIKKKENLLYLTGYSFDGREEYLLVTKKMAVGLGSGLERIGWIKKSDQLKNIGRYLGGENRLDIEYKFTYGEGAYLKKWLPGKTVRPVYSPADRLRLIKGEEEIALVGRSMQIVEKVFSLARREIKKPGMTEARLAEFIKAAGLKFGAEGISFPPIVASGANAAVPHHVPGNKKLRAGEPVILDFGFKFGNYCSDFTRTVFIKSVSQKLAAAYNQVEKAYLESMEQIEGSLLGLPQKAAFKGAAAAQAHQKAVSVLAEKQLDKFFIHSLGHGTGLEIHEPPSLSPGSCDTLQNGMIFSIEPGVYFPRLGGVRIEDLVYLKQGRVKKFINVSTKLKDNIL